MSISDLKQTHDRIQKSIFLHAPRSRVWRAIADPNEFGKWFGVKFDGGFLPGSRVRGRIAPTKVDPEIAKLQAEHQGLAFEMTIDRFEPERVFAFRWHPYAVDPDVDVRREPTTLVSFEIADALDGGVILTLTESGFDRLPPARRAEAYEANDDGWTKQMKLIERHLLMS